MVRSRSRTRTIRSDLLLLFTFVFFLPEVFSAFTFTAHNYLILFAFNKTLESAGWFIGAESDWSLPKGCCHSLLRKGSQITGSTWKYVRIAQYIVIRTLSFVALRRIIWIKYIEAIFYLIWLLKWAQTDQNFLYLLNQYELVIIVVRWVIIFITLVPTHNDRF